MRTLLLLLLAALVLPGCKRYNSSTSSLPTNFSGVWAGDAGPDLNALKFGAKIEIREDGGSISGEFFNEDPEKPGVYLPTGQIQGTRDGWTLFLTTGGVTDLGDGGTLQPQMLLLSYDGNKLVGLRKLQLPGRHVVNEYLILRR